jgi:transcriptional regulator of arginine metabolism
MDHSLVEALKELLFSREAQTQDDLSDSLIKKGFDVNQSKISRLLRKLGAIKVENTKGQTVYSLPREPSPPTLKTELRELILDVTANEALVVIFTSPGSASMVARMLDYAQIETDILGTVAGDDTIFVAPKSIKETKALKDEIKDLLLG